MTRRCLTNALLLASLMACLAARPGAAAGREPVVDPYYARREAAINGESPLTASVDPEAVTATDDSELAQPTSYDKYYMARAQEPGTATVMEAAPPAEYLDQGIVDEQPIYDDATYDTAAYDDNGRAGSNTCNGSADCGCGACGAHEGKYLSDFFACPKRFFGMGGGGTDLYSSVLWTDAQRKYHAWVGIDYLNFWAKGNALPPLVTTSPLGTSQSDAGVLGESTTQILFGNNRVNTGNRPGGRIQFGYWLAEGEFLALDGHYYALESESTNYSRSSSFSPANANSIILARPFFNAALDIQDSLVLAYPDFIAGGLSTDLSGSVNVSTSSDIQSAGFGLRHLLFVDFYKDHRSFLTGGYRFFKLDEDLSIAHRISPDGGIFLPGTFFDSYDNFNTTNQFHGGYVGYLHDIRRGRWSLQTNLQIAMGNMRQIVDIQGQQVIYDGISTTTSEGGLLTKPSNIGRHAFDKFCVIPEIETKLGLQILPGVRATFGYNFTYVSRVVRPGNEVDLVVNPNQSQQQIVGPARPEVKYNPTDLWLQGFTTGVEFRF